MTRLKMALRAFWIILSGKHHAYADDKYRSLLGSHADITKYQAQITDLYNTEVYQSNVLKEAQEILKR